MNSIDPYASRNTDPQRANRRTTRVTQTASSAGSERRSPEAGALIPQRRASDRAVHATPVTLPHAAPVSTVSAKACVCLQAELSAPRRGLRADAVERNRYRKAYHEAGRAFSADRPSFERCA